MFKLLALLTAVSMLMTSAFAAPRAHAVVPVSRASFAEFDRRARAGERLTVVFFGASLTWGANSSDPQQTSYRADMARKFEAAYPKAHFHFRDGAIGGTGSQLGVFRLERDALRYHPDLVFLDFTANDDIYSADPESLASYESLVRRVVGAGIPLVQVIFPFRWNIKVGEMAKMRRRDAHLAIAKAYGTGVGDAVALANERVAAGTVTLDTVWPIDGVHPGDKGYALFADAAWQGYEQAVQHKQVCTVPDQMLNASTYMNIARVRISTMGPLPQGWHVGAPNRISAWYDGLMSRWLDDEVIASNRRMDVGADGKKTQVPQTVESLKFSFRGSMVLLFGEETLKSGKYRILIDGKDQFRTPWGSKTPTDEYDASAIRFGGNRQHAQVVASGLDATVPHSLEIQPILSATDEQELRLESVCVAGPGASVSH